MITKILLTAFVILAALMFLRHKGAETRKEQLAREAEQAADRKMAMVIAAALVTLTLAISGWLYYSHWQDEHRLFQVTVINTLTGGEKNYQVYQSDIDGRSFRTIEGRLISLSDAERMEVELLPSE